MQRYFITAESTYEDLRQSLNTQLAYPNSLGKSVFQTALQAPRDSFRRVLLAVDTDIQGYATIAAAITPLLDSDAMEEVDEATYLAAVSSSPASGASAWDDITGKPSTFTPAAHKASHATGGTDALSPADIGAAAASHAHSASDTTSGEFDPARLPIATANARGAVRIGSGISIDGNGVISASAGDSVSIDTTAADVLSAASGAISADDPGADRLVFWDDSAGKLTHLTVGSGLTISGTTITSAGSTSASDLTSGTLADARLTAKARAAINVFNWSSFR